MDEILESIEFSDLSNFIPFIPMPRLVHVWRKLLEKESNKLCPEQRQAALKLLPQIKDFMEKTSIKESDLLEVKMATLADLQVIENLLVRPEEKVVKPQNEDLPNEIPTNEELEEIFDKIPF